MTYRGFDAERTGPLKLRQSWQIDELVVGTISRALNFASWLSLCGSYICLISRV